MAIERDTFLEVLKDAYSAYYDVKAAEHAELPLCFQAEYRSHDEKYWLTRSIKIWENERNEYVYVFSAPGFDVATADRCIEWALQDMLPRVKPHKEHQYTNAKVLLVADEIGEDTAAAVKKKRFSKSYGPLSMHGYSELVTAAVDLSREKTFPNRAGNDLPKFFGKLFALRQEKT